MQDSASYGDLESFVSAQDEEGHIGLTSAKGVNESRRTLRQSHLQTR